MKNKELTGAQIDLKTDEYFRNRAILHEEECINWTCSEIQLKYQEISKPTIKIVTAKDAYEVIKNSADMDSASIQEHFWAIYISNSGEAIGFRTICTGNLNSVGINVQLILSIALILNSQRIIIAHSHPSGNLRPSNADVEFTKRFIEASRILNILVADHLIITKDDYCSLLDAHFVDFDFVYSYKYEGRKYEITDGSLLAFPLRYRKPKTPVKEIING